MDYLSDILIIDDVLHEAYDLVALFAKNNCTSTMLTPEHVFAKTWNLTPKFICCDINLYTTADEETNYKLILDLLKHVFSKNKGVYILIVWTSHEKQLEDLKKYIFSDADVNKPVCMFALGKAEFTNEITKFKEELKTQLETQKGLEALLVWNRIIKEANDKTVDKLFDLSKETKTELLDLLFCLAKANIGKDNINDNEIVALIKPIDYILRDNIDKELIQNKTKSFFQNIFKNVNKDTNLIENIKIKTNFILHINTNIEHEDIIPGDVIKSSQEAIQKLFNVPNFSEKFLECLTNDKKVDGIIWGLLEVTPDCDFSNNKIHNINKFVPIYLIPKNRLSNKVKNVDYFKHTNLEIEYEEQHYVFVADCRFIFSIKADELNTNKIFSLRENIFTSYRQYVYSYNSRIGTISF